jgi:hypothetical protein
LPESIRYGQKKKVYSFMDGALWATMFIWN